MVAAPAADLSDRDVPEGDDPSHFSQLVAGQEGFLFGLGPVPVVGKQIGAMHATHTGEDIEAVLL